MKTTELSMNIASSASASVLEDPFLASVEATLKVGVDYIYYLMTGSEIVYVGITKNIMQRLSAHNASKKAFDSARYTVLPNDCEPLVVEFFEIVRHQPKYNSAQVSQGIGFATINVCRNYFDRSIHLKTLRKAIELHYPSNVPEIHGVKFYRPDEVVECVEKYRASQRGATV